MDRYEADWEMVERGWKAHVLGEADVTGKVASEVVTKLKEDTGANDQNLDAFVIVDDDGAPVGKVSSDPRSQCLTIPRVALYSLQLLLRPGPRKLCSRLSLLGRQEYPCCISPGTNRTLRSQRARHLPAGIASPQSPESSP
jgi:hypothetical protein